MKVARKGDGQKGLISFLFERIGDTIITAIRLWRLFSSRRGRKKLAHVFKKRKNRLWSIFDRVHRFQRKVLARAIKRVRKVKFWWRRQTTRIADFHRRTPAQRLVKLYLVPLAIFSVIVCVIAVSFGSRVRTTPDKFPEISQRQKLNKLLDETSQLIAANQLKQAEKNIAELNRLSPENPTVLTYSGAIHSLQRQFDEARKYYTHALKLNPDDYNIQFNLAEIEFVTKNYATARQRFLQMQQSRPNDEILNFRLFLCALLQDDQVASEIFLTSLPRTGLTPARQYADAAILFQKKEKGRARQTVEQAKAMYPDKTAFFDATFRELGWN